MLSRFNIYSLTRDPTMKSKSRILGNIFCVYMEGRDWFFTEVHRLDMGDAIVG